MRRFRARPGGDRDPYDLAILPRETGEQGFDQAGEQGIEAVGCRPRLRTSVEQRLIGAGSANVEIKLAMIFDPAVDA